MVGESGAGKSLTGAAIIGLIDPPGRIAAGEIRLAGRRIDNLPYDAMRTVRGREIGAIFQDPLTSLNPLYTVGRQLIETIRTHLPMSEAEARDARRSRLLEEVGIPAAARRIDHYPHQFSGGMRQRVVIALALAAKPKLIVADEPTTALDVSIQAQIIQLLKRLCRDHGTAVMLVTHDMGVIAETADRVAVMYAGPHRRDRAGRRRDPPAAAPVHGRADGLDPVDRRRARAPDADRRRDAAARRPFPPAARSIRAARTRSTAAAASVPSCIAAGATRAACWLRVDGAAAPAAAARSRVSAGDGATLLRTLRRRASRATSTCRRRGSTACSSARTA